MKGCILTYPVSLIAILLKEPILLCAKGQALLILCTDISLYLLYHIKTVKTVIFKTF